MATTPAAGTVRAAVDALLPTLLSDLDRLARIPSVAAAGSAAQPLLDAHDALVDQLRAAGVEAIDDLLLPGMTAPTIVADVPGPDGAPTVLVYGHYDVVPAGDPDLWRTPPWEPTTVGDAVHGRGVADSKANLVALLGALRVVGGRPPVHLRIVVEGHEEFGSPFEEHPAENPGLFAADAMVIADVGSVRPGVATLTTALRGSASITVTARTLAADKHSGQYGGAAPDARLALIRALATLHDDAGDVAVPGLRREDWTGTTYTEDEFRELAEVLDGVPVQGTGDLGSRIWTGPAITVIAFDAPPTSAPLNAVASSATAVLNLRVHPQQDAAQAQAAVVSHLAGLRPFGVELTVTPGETGNGFAAPQGGPAFRAAERALAQAWGGEVTTMAGGGSIPIVMAFHEAVPQAEMLLFGATDGYSNIHGPNERVLVPELVSATVAMVLFWHEYAAGRGQP